MMSDEKFTPRLDILPPAQRQLWDLLGEIPSDFVLYGGTALALHLGHRQSEDFDFFGSKIFKPGELYDRINFLSGAQVIQQVSSTLSVIVHRDGPVKVSFFGLPNFRRLQEPFVTSNGVKVAQLIDLAGTKVAVVQQRAEMKDYLDIAALVRNGIELSIALSAAMEIYGDRFNPQISLKALSFFGDGDLDQLSDNLKSELTDAVKRVDLDRLPKV